MESLWDSDGLTIPKLWGSKIINVLGIVDMNGEFYKSYLIITPYSQDGSSDKLYPSPIMSFW